MPTCRCAVCTSADARDKRLRSSCLITTADDRHILIDCGPDFRQQALRADIQRLDALLVTHNHFDHVAGVDDLRAYCYRQPLDTYCDPIVTRNFIEKYDYIFVHKYPGVPNMTLHELQGDEEIFIGQCPIRPVRLRHGKLPIFGWRIGRLAYLTDCTEIQDGEWEKLADVDTLIIDALRWKEHPTHFSVAQALEVVGRIKPRQTYFTHMSHDIGLHVVANAELPAGVELAYDGLVINVPD